MKTRFSTWIRKPVFEILPRTRFQNPPQNPISGTPPKPVFIVFATCMVDSSKVCVHLCWLKPQSLWLRTSDGLIQFAILVHRKYYNNIVSQTSNNATLPNACRDLTRCTLCMLSSPPSLTRRPHPAGPSCRARPYQPRSTRVSILSSLAAQHFALEVRVLLVVRIAVLCLCRDPHQVLFH
eukprot:COSAG02_NODE_8967_length_2379_cov_4.312281_1_plen_180_part_00